MIQSSLLRGVIAIALVITFNGAAIPVLARDKNAPAVGQATLPLNAITVSANKRPEAYGRVNASLTVRTAEELTAAGVTRVQDLEKVVPGLVIRMRGNRAYTSFSMRGASAPDFYNPAIQVYVDGIPQDPAYFTQALLDVERVEVLRGPQGTLYGKNAQGGIINVITRQPGKTATGRIGGRVANTRYGGDIRLSRPILEGAVSASLNLRRSGRDGEIDDIATGREAIDDSAAWTGSGKIHITPAGIPLGLTALWRHDSLDTREELYLLDRNVSKRRYNSAAQGGVNRMRRRVNTFALSARYDFGPAQLSSVTAFQDRDMFERLIQGFQTPEFQETLSQELRLNLALGDSWQGVAGLYAEHREFKRSTPAFSFGVAGFGPSENTVSSASLALFGEATYALTDTFDLTAGLRWSRQQSEIDYQRSNPIGLRIRDQDRFEEISPKIALGWQIMKQHRLFGILSRGFKPGGFNHAILLYERNPATALDYDSETSTNLEIGWRGGFWDDRVLASAAAYFVSTRDKQIYVGPAGFQYLRNAGHAESYGVELDARFSITDNLVVELGATFGRSKFTRARNPDTGESFNGKNLPYAPDTTLRAAADYLVPQDFLPGEVVVRLAGAYTGRAYFDEANALSQAGYGLLDASIDWELDNGASIRVFTDNITDQIYRTYSFKQQGNVFSSTGNGRRFGIALQFVF